MHPRTLPALTTVLATIGAASAIGATGPALAPPTVPAEPAALSTPLVLDGPGDGVIAFTGSVRNARVGHHADRAAAERAGLTTFDVRSAHNGFLRFVVSGTSTCLDLQPFASGAVAAPTDNGCVASSGLWTVDDGDIVSASGPVLTDELVTVDGTPSIVAANDHALGAPTDIVVRYGGALPAAAADFSVPTGPDDRVVASGTGRTGDEVLLSDGVGNELGTAEVQADGRWQAAVTRRDDAGGPLDVLVSVVRADAVVGRSWHEVAYGAAVTVDQSSVPRGAVELTGTGEAGARVSVAGGADADPTTVAADRTWRVRATVRAEVGQRFVVQQVGAGGARSAVQVPVDDASVVDAGAVFPVDDVEPAYIEGDTEPGREVEARNADRDLIGSATADRYGHYEIDVPAPGRGGAASFDVVESEGGSAVSNGSVEFDFGAPVVITEPTGGAEVGDRYDVGGTGEPGAEVALEVDGATVRTTVGDDGRWTAEVGAEVDPTFRLDGPDTLRFSDRSKPALTGTGAPGATVRFQPKGSGDASDATETTVHDDGTWRIDGADLRVRVPDDHDAAVVHRPGADQEVRPIRLEADVRPVAVTSPSDGDVVRTTDGRVTITGTATPGDHVTMVANDVTMPRSVTVSADGTWEMTQVFAAGDHSLRFVTENGSLAGHRITVEPDGVGTLVVTSPRPGAVVDGTAGVLFTGSATPGSLVSLRFDRPVGPATSVVAGPDGSWSVRATRAPFGDVTVYASVAGGVPSRFALTVQ